MHFPNKSIPGQQGIGPNKVSSPKEPVATESSTGSGHAEVRTPEDIKKYEAKLGFHLAAAWMIARFLRIQYARDLKAAAGAIVGEDKFEECILELYVDKV